MLKSKLTVFSWLSNIWIFADIFSSNCEFFVFCKWNSSDNFVNLVSKSSAFFKLSVKSLVNFSYYGSIYRLVKINYIMLRVFQNLNTSWVLIKSALVTLSFAICWSFNRTCKSSIDLANGLFSSFWDERISLNIRSSSNPASDVLSSSFSNVATWSCNSARML